MSFGKAPKWFRNARLAMVITASLAATTLALNLANTWLEKLTDKLGFADRPIEQLVGALAVIVLIVFVVLLYKLPGVARRLGASAEVLSQQELPPRRFFITGISVSSNSEAVNGRTATGPKHTNLAEWGPDRLQEALHQDTGRQAFTNWQQNLRVLASCPGVEHVYVLENDRGEFDLFAKVMRRFFPNLTFKRIEDRGTLDPDKPFTLSSRKKRNIAPDYEDFLYVTAGIDRAIQMICEEHHLSPHEAEASSFLDATPGTKPLSIISAIVSVNRPILFVYCSATERPGRKEGKWEVIAYDIHMEVRKDQAG